MRKLVVLAILSGLVAGAAFAGGQSEPGTATGAKKTDLLWYIWDDPATQGHQQIADEFMRLNPSYNVSISRTPFSKYEETIRTILAGGDVPDVIQINDDHVKFYAYSGWVADLNDIAKGWTIKREDTYTNFWDFNFYKGNMVSVTPVVKVRLHWYNADMFREAGLTTPPLDWQNPKWTWDTALQAAKKLNKTEGTRTTVWGYSVDHEAAAASAWIDNNIPGPNDQYSQDGTKFLAATPPGYEAMQWIVDLTTVHKVQPPWGINKDNSVTQNLFYSGQMGMFYDGSWLMPALSTNAEFDWRATSLPMKVEGHTQASLVCYGVPAAAKQIEASGKFANFLMEEFTQKTWAENGFAIPVVKKYANKYYVSGDYTEQKQVIADGLEYAFAPNFSVYTSKAKSLWDNSYRLVWSGEKTAKEVMTSIKPEIEDLLNNR